MLSSFQNLAKEFFQDTVKLRRHLHAHPELSFLEKETSAFVAKELRNIGLNPQEGVADTGVTALIQGERGDGPCIALRADMDALPITEQNQVPYVSQNPGVMHACGHDVHTSSLLTAARILNTLKGNFAGSVKLIFQPGEEKAPGGASLMIKEGVLNGVNEIVGQHVAPNIPVGKIGFREGMYMASTDEIYMRVHGKGGHGASPHTCVDPVVVSSHIIVALQQIISRNKNPSYPSVLTFGKVVAEGATNIIPNEVYIEGTFRCMNEEWRAEGLQKMQKMAENMAEAMGARCEFWVVKGYPFLNNHPELTRRIRQHATEYMGEENIVDLDLWMGGEDFAFYSQVVDASFYRLGTRNEEKGIISGVHTPTFDIDEKALEIGPGLMAYMAYKELA
ncbi:amidohydrolase [Leadbetterella byssophila DSM 17132]|uniref:Amidohydrolase n=1 Tax=Leadbetterella byssophila (strain DSM 17132 / JCM 16389 / KACC 11308 / NBRC 106382 / 4M15) TaxID=649349 RepID=E4RW83_LEAB4|nr:M20 family metallopeptidase [Leadbetterella byssophila]ADQ17118.1 amidohydrolase [Leadbetterella byssophila DSM 17132]